MSPLSAVELDIDGASDSSEQSDPSIVWSVSSSSGDSISSAPADSSDLP
jgi:hypothetical protein